MPSLEIAELINDKANSYIFYSSIFLLFIGLISNILIILIFNTLRIFRSNQCAYYLKVESIADIGLLLAILPSNIVGHGVGQNPAQLSTIWCKIELMCSYGCGLYSLSTICFLAFDQYLSTNHRRNWRQISTLKLARRLTYFDVSLVLFHAIIFLIFAEIGAAGCSIYHPIPKIYFTYFYFPFLSGTLPILISMLFSLLAYQNVRRIIRRQIPLERRQLDHEMTALALARVLCMLILGVPFIIFSLCQINLRYKYDDHLGTAIFGLLSAIIYSLLYCNYSINFYVFLIISPRFRHQVKRFFIKRIWRSLTRLRNSRSTIPSSNRIVPEICQGTTSVVESI